MPKGPAKKIQDILDGLRAERMKLHEQQEEFMKKFMADRGLTLFELITDYKFISQETKGFPETFDDFDLDNNTYKYVMETTYGFRKRTPEERELFLQSINRMDCDCEHPKMVHAVNFNVVTGCLEPDCTCGLYISKEKTDENPDHGES